MGLLCITVNAMLAQHQHREILILEGRLMLNQPQPQEVEGNNCIGVCASSFLPTRKKDPLVEASFFDAKMQIDRDIRRYQVSSIQIPDIKFSGSQHDVNLDKIKAAVIREVPTWKLQGSLDELLATV